MSFKYRYGTSRIDVVVSYTLKTDIDTYRLFFTPLLVSLLLIIEDVFVILNGLSKSGADKTVAETKRLHFFERTLAFLSQLKRDFWAQKISERRYDRGKVSGIATIPKNRLRPRLATGTGNFKFALTFA